MVAFEISPAAGPVHGCSGGVARAGTGLTPEAAMRRPKLDYAHQQALAFVGALMFFGALAGALVAAIKGGLR